MQLLAGIQIWVLLASILSAVANPKPWGGWFRSDKITEATTENAKHAAKHSLQNLTLEVPQLVSDETESVVQVEISKSDGGTRAMPESLILSSAPEPAVATIAREIESAEEVPMLHSSASVETSFLEASVQAVTRNPPEESESSSKTVATLYEESLQRTAEKWGITIDFFQNNLTYEFFKVIGEISSDLVTHANILLSETCRDERIWNDTAPKKNWDDPSLQSCSNSKQDRNDHGDKFTTLVARYAEAKRAATVAKESASEFVIAFAKLFHVLLGNFTHSSVSHDNPSGRNLPIRKADDEEELPAISEGDASKESAASSNTGGGSLNPEVNASQTTGAATTVDPFEDTSSMSESPLLPESGEFEVEATVVFAAANPEDVSSKTLTETSTAAIVSVAEEIGFEDAESETDTLSVQPRNESSTESSAGNGSEISPVSTTAFRSLDSYTEVFTEATSSNTTQTTTPKEMVVAVTTVSPIKRSSNHSGKREEAKKREIMRKQEELRNATKSGNHKHTIRTMRLLQDYEVPETDLSDFEVLPKIAKLSFRHKFLQIRERVDDDVYVMVASKNSSLKAVKLEDGGILNGSDRHGSEWSFRYPAGEKAAFIKNKLLKNEFICAEDKDSVEESDTPVKVPTGSVYLTARYSNNSFCRWRLALKCEKEKTQNDEPVLSNEVAPSPMNGVELECHLELRSEGAPDWTLGIDSSGTVRLEEMAIGHGDKLELGVIDGK